MRISSLKKLCTLIYSIKLGAAVWDGRNLITSYNCLVKQVMFWWKKRLCMNDITALGNIMLYRGRNEPYLRINKWIFLPILPSSTELRICRRKAASLALVFSFDNLFLYSVWDWLYVNVNIFLSLIKNLNMLTLEHSIPVQRKLLPLGMCVFWLFLLWVVAV